MHRLLLFDLFKRIAEEMRPHYRVPSGLAHVIRLSRATTRANETIDFTPPSLPPPPYPFLPLTLKLPSHFPLLNISTKPGNHRYCNTLWHPHFFCSSFDVCIWNDVFFRNDTVLTLLCLCSYAPSGNRLAAVRTDDAWLTDDASECSWQVRHAFIHVACAHWPQLSLYRYVWQL